MRGIALSMPAVWIIRLAESVFATMLAIRAILVLAPSIALHPQVALFLTAEIVSVVLILLQRPGQVMTSVRPLVLGFVGSCAALLIRQTGAQLASDSVSTSLLVAGALISISAKICLARSFGIVPANRGVRTVGLYNFVRHPMYLGYMVSHVGMLLIFPGPWNIAVVMFAWSLLWMRIGEEEKVLMRDAAYREYASRVRSRLVPGLI